MKNVLLILFLIIFGCETKDKKSVSKYPKNNSSVIKNSEIENKKFFIGDINNDKISDTAFISIKRSVETGDVECGEKNCSIDIKFSKNVPNLSIDQSLGVFIKEAEDVNNDKANEIIVFSRTNEGWWNDISIWTFQKGKWNEIATTKGFVSENKDFENRIIRENNNYYLVGEDQWNEDKNGNFEKIKIKI